MLDASSSAQLVSNIVFVFKDGLMALLPIIAPVVILVVLVFSAYKVIKNMANRSIGESLTAWEIIGAGSGSVDYVRYRNGIAEYGSSYDGYKISYRKNNVGEDIFEDL